jgi:hypothetical protein
MISSLSSQTGSLAGASRASRLPGGRRRLALTPSAAPAARKASGWKEKYVLFVGPINPKSVTSVPVRLLPFFPVQTLLQGRGNLRKILIIQFFPLSNISVSVIPRTFLVHFLIQAPREVSGDKPQGHAMLNTVDAATRARNPQAGFIVASLFIGKFWSISLPGVLSSRSLSSSNCSRRSACFSTLFTCLLRLPR